MKYFIRNLSFGLCYRSHSSVQGAYCDLCGI